MNGCKTSIKKLKDVAEATALVLDWFERENKPATPQSLTDALGSRVAKTLLQKILDQLHAESKLCVKDLKKIRFYYLRMPESETETADQGSVAAPLLPSITAVTTENPTQRNGEASGAVDAMAATTVLCEIGLAGSSLAEKQHRLTRWRGWGSREERAAQQAAAEAEVRRLEVNIAELQRGNGDGNDEEAENSERRACRTRRAVRHYRRARHLWVERKGWAMRLLEATGGDVHSPQHMAGLLGCTTDADAGVSFESTAVPLPIQTLREIGLI